MKFRMLLFFSFVVLLSLTTGCSNTIGDEKQNIVVQKRVSVGNEYENFKIITENDKVEKIKKILKKVDWKDEKLNMDRPADYRFIFQFKDSKIEAKAVGYEIWINPNIDKVEIVEASNKYALLNEENSAVLYEVLTGEKLSKLE